MEQIANTFFWYVLLSLTWQWLELLIHGEITSRTVDDIMMFCFLPFIWKAMEK